MDDDVHSAPCGCRFQTIGEAFVMKPCALDCELFLYAMRTAREQGKPIKTAFVEGEYEH